MKLSSIIKYYLYKNKKTKPKGGVRFIWQKRLEKGYRIKEGIERSGKTPPFKQTKKLVYIVKEYTKGEIKSKKQFASEKKRILKSVG